MLTYCVKQRKKTKCVPGSETIVVTKNGRNAMKCICAECGITKFRFLPGKKGPSSLEGAGFVSDIKTKINQSRDKAAAKLRDQKLQKNTVDYLIEKSRPSLYEIGSSTMNKLANVVETKKR